MTAPSDPANVTVIDGRIGGIGGWRGAMLAHMRALIREALPDVVETMEKPST